MKAIILLVSLVLLITAIIILFTETGREELGMGMILCTLAGYGFRVVTEED